MKITLTLFLFISLAISIMAQAPQVFKYQAVARDPAIFCQIIVSLSG